MGVNDIHASLLMLELYHVCDWQNESTDSNRCAIITSAKELCNHEAAVCVYIYIYILCQAPKAILLESNDIDSVYSVSW